MAQDHQDRPLKIAIVGGGIGGLTAALGLRKSGHHVIVFERSQFAQETGAAIHIAPNCHGILRRLGVCPETFGANPVQGIIEYNAETGCQNFQIDLKNALSIWQHPWMLSHRVRLHEELKRLATESEGEGNPVKLQVSSTVISIDCKSATVELADGTKETADLVLGADGVSSITRSSIAGTDVKPYNSGKNAFRFLIPCERLKGIKSLDCGPLLHGYMTLWIGSDRRFVMYPCENNKMMNFVAIHPTELSDPKSRDTWESGGSKQALLEIYSTFGSAVNSILELVDDAELKVWTLLDMKRISQWTRGRAALLGDAAHPFLPHQGQGAGIAIEDAASLCALLPRGTRTADLEDRLQLYQRIRDERAHRIQEYTRQAGKDFDDDDRGDFNILEFVNYNFNHDEWHNSAHILKKHLWSQQKVAYRSPLSFGPMPGPRQDQFGRSLIGANSRSHFSTYSITFKTSATLLKTWFPTPSFTFTSPGTVAEVTLECTKLDQLYWLGQKGYNFVALWIHGVQYTRKDGSSIQGSFLPVLFESSADPIITGRDELGMPKLFCDIDITKANSITNITCTWKETTFLDITVEDVLDTDQIQQNSDNTKSTGLNSTALYYRYVPSVGNPHTSDAEYAVAIDQSTNQEEEVKHKGLGSAILRFQKANRESLPTLHHIAEALSEMPIIGTPKATYREGFSRGALSGPERLE